MPDNTGFLPTQTLDLPKRMDREEEVDIREAMWWQLGPGEVGYSQPIWAYCGFTEDEWRLRCMDRGWR